MWAAAVIVQTYWSGVAVAQATEIGSAATSLPDAATQQRTSQSTNGDYGGSDGDSNTSATVAAWATYAPPSAAPTAAPVNPLIFVEGSKLVAECNDTIIRLGSGASAVSIEVSAAASTITAQLEEAEHLAVSTQILRGELLNSLDEVSWLNDGTESRAARLVACADQNQILGIDDICYEKRVTCPRLNLPENMTVKFEPEGLSHEMLPGVMAIFSCSSGHVGENISKSICTTTGVWTMPVPTCQACTELVRDCSRCSHGTCHECSSPLQLTDDGTACIRPGTDQRVPARDCDELLDIGSPTGNYWLKGNADQSEAVLGFCDQETSGGGWTLLTVFQEWSQSEGPERFSSRSGRLWIEGCGTTGSIGCYGLGPDMPGFDWSRRNDMRSLDWRSMLVQGQRYNLRQTVGVGYGNFTVRSNSWHELGGYLDVAYNFVYPGWVTQDTNGGGQAAEQLVWHLSSDNTAPSIWDDTGVAWEDRLDRVAFYPPWGSQYRGQIVNGCSSYTYTSYNGRCGSGYSGSAGIVSMYSDVRRDPPGVAFMPHRPTYTRTCLMYGPHQGGVRYYSNYCGRGNVVGGYWFRRNRS